jgi:hypothetical protein
MIQLNKINFLSNKNENLLIKKEENVLKKEKIMKGKTNTTKKVKYIIHIC